MRKHNQILQNAAWIVGCKIAQSVLNVLVTMLTARFYGPANYGLLNYAASVVAFAAPLMKLGLSTTLVQEIVNDPRQEGTTLGTALAMNLAASLLSLAGIAAFVSLANPGQTITLVVCLLYGLNLPFQALEMLQYWFQAKLRSKYMSISMLVAYILVSAYKLFLLITGKSICWFAISQALDYGIISLCLLVIYHRLGGQKLRFSPKRGREMLKKSRYYIVSSLMITVFAQTDKIMLKGMLGDTVTGYYSAAVNCAGLTSFLFSAIIDSAKPPILRSAKGENQDDFRKKMTLLYQVVIYLSLAQCVGIVLFAPWIIRILYGSAYQPAIPILRIAVWYTTFSYLGSARTVWILGKEKHNLLWRINLYGALANVVLNLLLIRLWGANGAALASLVTQIFTNVLIGFLDPQLRENNALMLHGLDPRGMLRQIKQFLRNDHKC